MADENDAKHVDTTQDHMLSNSMYDGIKVAAQYVLPGLGALYFALAGIWGLPFAEEIIGTITAVDIFLGVLLGISKKSYNNSDSKFDGELTSGTDGMPRLVVNTALEDANGSVLIKVPKPPVDGGSQQ